MKVFNVTLNVNLHVPTFVWRALVSKLSDLIRAATDEADKAIERVSADRDMLQTKIAELEARGDTPSEEDLFALQVLRKKIAAIDPTDPSVLSDPSRPTPAI